MKNILTRTSDKKLPALILLIVLILSLNPLVLFAGKNYYFSSSIGDDARTIAQAQSSSTPWKTITKLNSFFSSLLPGDSVLFKRGDTFTGGIVISKSGTADNPIVVGAYGTGANPIITALATLTGWTNMGSNVWKKNSPASKTTLSFVSVDNKFTGAGRYPNTGYLKYESVTGTTAITDNQLSATPNWTGGSVVIREIYWTHSKYPISNHTGTTITYSGSTETPAAGFGYFVQDDLDALDLTGEWYFNTSTKDLSMYFADNNPALHTIKAPIYDTLVYIANRNYITLTNLTLEGANFNSVYISSGSHNNILNCNVYKTGADAITSNGQYTTVDGCTVIDGHADGVAIMGFYSLVQNNLIRRMGLISGGYRYTNAIETYQADNSLIQYNEIDSCGYNGIFFRANNNVIVKNNFIHNVCLNMSDGGAIYSTGINSTGKVITGNIIINSYGEYKGTYYNEPWLGEGIYLDEPSDNILVTDNTVANCSASGLRFHNSHSMTVRGNTFYNNYSQFRSLQNSNNPGDPVRNNVIKGNKFISKTAGQWVFRLESAYNDNLIFGSLDSNYFCRPIDDNLTIKTEDPANGSINRSLDGWKSFTNQDQHSKKSPQAISNENDILFEYNASLVNKVIPLNAIYLGVDGTVYSNSITLLPYKSVILIKSSNQNLNMNQPPVIQDQSFQISNSSVNGSTVGKVIASDPNTDQTITYSILSENTGGAFAINSSTGVITVANSGSLVNDTAGSSYSLFQSVTPSGSSTNYIGIGSTPLEVGMKFKSNVDGYITGFRYYKGTGGQGTHIGNLWTIAGVKLASATFTGETASGWQTVTLSSPVAITANTIYVVSYFSPNGDFVKTTDYFTKDIVNGPLTGLGWTAAQPNGVYIYSSGSAFPNNNAYVGNTNYWADVIFSSSSTSDSWALAIQVQDNGIGNLASQATVTISKSLTNNIAPVINNQAFSVAENSSNGTTVGSVIATDPDAGQTKTFSIVSGNTSTAFTINASTGVLTIANSAALNFEVTPNFSLVIKVQDNGTPVLSNQATVTISLLDVNESPVITNQSFSLSENSIIGSTVGTIIATDPDAGQTKIFSILSGNTNGAFAINTSTGVLTVASSAALNFEVTPSFALVVKVQDNGTPALSSQATITLSLIDVNEAPVITNQSLSVAENSANGTIIGTIVASDPDAGQTKAFSIISGNTNGAFLLNASTGVLSVANSTALNFESINSFSLVVKVQDNGVGSLSSQAIITISVTDINEAPVISNQSFTIAENSANGTIVGTIVASDPDAGQTKTFSIISGNTSGAFTVNALTGVLTVSNSSVLNFENIPSFILTVKVQDNGTGNLSSQAVITVNLLDVNELPVINNQIFSISENSANGTTVGTVIASDPDAGQTKSFSILSGNSSGAFAINASTGVLSVANSAVLNFEATQTFALIVKVQDNGTGNLSNQATITVNLLDVNEPPVINNQTFSIAENSANGTTVGTVVATDPDASQTKTFSIVSGNTNGAFAINALTGVLSVTNYTALNYEVTPNFSLIIKVQDNGIGNLSSQATISVIILDINEVPVIANQSFSVAENSANASNIGTVVASDPDAGQTKTFSIVSGNTNSAFNINASTGTLTVANSSALNFENITTFTLVVKVQDNGAGNLSSQAIITISVIDVNEQPVIANQSFVLAENPANGTTVGNIIATDPDAGQTLSYSIISGNINGAFVIQAATGILTVANSTAINFEAIPSFSLGIKVQDNGAGALSSQATITVTITDVNEAPVITNQTFTIAENSLNGTTVGTVVASDPDAGQTKTFSIISGNTNGAFILNASTGVLTVANSGILNFEITPSFSLVIKVQDNGVGNLSSQATITVSLIDVNEAPQISNQSFSIAENSANGTTVGIAIASDPDLAQTKTFSIVSGNINGGFILNSLTGILTVANSTALNFESTPIFNLVIKVQDNGGLSSQANLTVSLTDVNEVPVINNQNFNVLEFSTNGTSVGLIYATDPDAGQSLSYQITSGNTENAFSINTLTGELKVLNSTILDFSINPTFALGVKIIDNGIGNLSAEAIVNVNISQSANQAPVIFNQSFSIAENSANLASVGTVFASDPDAGQTKTFSIVSGNTNTAFAINASTGVLTVANSTALNFENTPSFALIIKVQDNGVGTLSDQATITVSLLDINEVPVITNQYFSVAENSENGTTVGTATASDPDAGQTLTFSIVSGNTGVAFAINAATGILTVANFAELNFENTPSFALIIKVQDNGSGNLSSQATITVSLIDVNEAPIIANQSFSVAENSANGTNVGTLYATDPDFSQTKNFSIISGNTNGAFAINASSGTITVANNEALNFQVSPSFALVVKVQDNGTGNLSSQAIVTITLADVNQAPAIANQSFSIAESSVNGTMAGTVLASDPDAGQTKTFSIVSGNTNTAFAINASTGVLTVSNSTALNFENTPSFTLIIKVQDNGVGNLSSQATITVSLLDINEVPVITNQYFSVAENSENGTTVGTATASDPDAGQTLTFSIVSGNTGGAFAINAATGILTVANFAELNFENTPSFALIIKVHDNGSGNLSSQATITVSLIDVNEAPIIANLSFSVAENSANGTNVGTLYATDPDFGQTKNFSIISGNTNGAFAVNASSGTITVANNEALNFQVSPSFALVVKVQDNGTGNLSSQAILTITLADVNQAPAIANQSFSIAENSVNGTLAGTVLASDPDAGQTKTFSIVSGNTNTAFAINASTGVLTVANSTALNFENTPSFALIIKVQDNGVGNLSSQATITVSITDINEEPVVSNQSFIVVEKSAVGTVIGTVLASDPDAGQSISFSIFSGNTNNAFAINPFTGLITVANTDALSYQVSSTFDLVIKVQDNGPGNLISQAIITVSLSDINEVPVISDQSFSLAENSPAGTIVGTVIASDPDANQTKTFSIISGNTNGAFVINASSGELTVANASILDFESTPSLNLVIRVEDNGVGKLSSQAKIIVWLTDINEMPVVPNQSFSVAKNTATGTIVGTIEISEPDSGQSHFYFITTGNASNAFSLDALTGELTVNKAAALAQGINSPFILGILVFDNGAGNLYSTGVAIVNVMSSPNQSPVISNQTLLVNYDSPAGTSVGIVEATDPNSKKALTYSILSGNTNGAFTINSSTGEIVVANSATLKSELAPSFSLVIKVQNNSQNNQSNQAIVTILILKPNLPPVILNQSKSTLEHQLFGTVVGYVSAFDPNPNSSLKYIIASGNTGEGFSLDTNTGCITINNSNAVCYEGHPIFSLIVDVVNIVGLSGEATITINVEDINETPVCNNQYFSIAENSPDQTTVGQIIAKDLDFNQTLTYAIVSGNDNKAFIVDPTNGILSVNNTNALNFEADSVFDLIVSVQDNGQGNLITFSNITIKILDINEAPVMENQALSVIENAAPGTTVGYLKAQDPDQGQVMKFKIVGGNDSHIFNLDDSSGLITVSDPSIKIYRRNSLIALSVLVQDNSADSLSTLSVITINVVPDTTQKGVNEAKLALIPDVFDENDISIYPNPTADIVNINLAKTEDQSVGIRVFSMTGSEIYSSVTKGEKNVVINMRNERAGTYIAALTLNGKVYTRNIVVKN